MGLPGTAQLSTCPSLRAATGCDCINIKYVTNDEFRNLTLKTHRAPVSSLVFSFSPAFIYGHGQWKRWGGRRTGWTGHQDTHTPHMLAVSGGNQNGSSPQKGQRAGIEPETWQHQSFTFTTNTGAYKSVFCKHAAVTVFHPGSRCPCCC